ncbi:MAG: RNA 3'-terminal phosphate cyclase [Myxococcota bacterium]
MSVPTVSIDGALGEGGGQILRTSLSLSTLLNIPFSIQNIRAHRKKKGLRPQHLTAVQASAQLAKAKLQGAIIGSGNLSYAPTQRSGGNHRFDIGTAGATTLLLHALYYPLALGQQASQLTLIGGTHVDKAPTFDYLHHVWLPMLQACGLHAQVNLQRYGFYPKGGGQLDVRIPPQQQSHGVEIEQRPPLDRISIFSVFASPQTKRNDRSGPQTISYQMGHSAQEVLQQMGWDSAFFCSEVQALSHGAVCLIVCHFGVLRAGFLSWGWKGRPAAQVGSEAAAMTAQFLKSPAIVDEWMADQWLLPLALASSPSSYTTPFLSEHLRTNAHIIQQFLPHVEIQLKQEKHLGHISIHPHT